MGSGKGGSWNNEVSSLVFDPGAPARERWKLFWHHFLLVGNAGQYANGWIGYKAAATPRDLLSAPEVKLFGTFAYKRENNTMNGPTGVARAGCAAHRHRKDGPESEDVRGDVRTGRDGYALRTLYEHRLLCAKGFKCGWTFGHRPLRRAAQDHPLEMRRSAATSGLLAVYHHAADPRRCAVLWQGRIHRFRPLFGWRSCVSSGLAGQQQTVEERVQRMLPVPLRQPRDGNPRARAGPSSAADEDSRPGRLVQRRLHLSSVSPGRPVSSSAR